MCVCLKMKQVWGYCAVEMLNIVGLSLQKAFKGLKIKHTLPI